MHVIPQGVSRDQFMARHHASHVNGAYGPTDEAADRALAAKAVMFAELGVHCIYAELSCRRPILPVL